MKRGVRHHRTALIATLFLRAMRFDALPFSAGFIMSIGSKTRCVSALGTLCGRQVCKRCRQQEINRVRSSRQPSTVLPPYEGHP